LNLCLTCAFFLLDIYSKPISPMVQWFGLFSLVTKQETIFRFPTSFLFCLTWIRIHSLGQPWKGNENVVAALVYEPSIKMGWKAFFIDFLNCGVIILIPFIIPCSSCPFKWLTRQVCIQCSTSNGHNDKNKFEYSARMRCG
jgi:hypothetical protein